MEKKPSSIKIEDHTSDYAERLLERKPEVAYVSMWEDLLKQEKASSLPQESSILVFRLGNEWLGLAIKSIQEILQVRVIHTVPSTQSTLLLGIVNVRGRLQLCVALHSLLDISCDWNPKELHQSLFTTKKYFRMVAIRRSTETWVFPVEEVDGVANCDFSTLSNLPTTVAKSSTNYLKGIWNKKGKSIGIIDEELVFESFRRLIP